MTRTPRFENMMKRSWGSIVWWKHGEYQLADEKEVLERAKAERELRKQRSAEKSQQENPDFFCEQSEPPEVLFSVLATSSGWRCHCGCS